MSIPQIILGAVVLALCIVTIACIGIQQGKSNGLGALTGESDTDTFFGKNKGRTIEAKLSKLTKIFAILFFISTLFSQYRSKLHIRHRSDGHRLRCM